MRLLGTTMIDGHRGPSSGSSPLLREADVPMGGHFHFGQAHRRIAGKPVWRSGAWVSRGHQGSVSRMLRYRNGRFERIGLGATGFHVCDDGR